MRHGGFLWGTAFIVVGGLLLLGTLGILTVNVWGLIWPALLILLGLWILFRGTYRRRGSVYTQQVSVPLAGATEVRLRLEYGAGHLSLGGNPTAGTAVSGSCSGGVDLRSHIDGGALKVEMSVPSGNFAYPWSSWGPRGYDWSLNLTPDVPLWLEMKTGACEARLDLSKLRVGNLRLDTGASSTDVVLPESAGYTRVDVHAGAASINLRVPSGVAARIRTSGGLSGITIDTARFPMTPNGYESADYSSAANRVDIDAETGVGSLDIR